MAAFNKWICLTLVYMSLLSGLVGCGQTGSDESHTGNNSNESDKTASQTDATSSCPDWDELTALLSKKLDSPEVDAFRKKYKLILSNIFGEQNLWPEGTEYNIVSRDGVIDRISVQVGISPFVVEESQAKTYSGKLPGGLKASDTIEDVSKKLGKPDSPDLYPSWIVGSHKLVFEFYDDKDGIESIMIHKHE